MIVDSSALVAIVYTETEAGEFVRILTQDAATAMSAGNYLEAAIVVDGSRDPRASREFDRLVRELGIAIEPITAEHARIARAAYRDFGKGSGHPAALNFGDCFAYALAIDKNEPLLYKGGDFAHTDVQRAV